MKHENGSFFTEENKIILFLRVRKNKPENNFLLVIFVKFYSVSFWCIMDFEDEFYIWENKHLLNYIKYIYEFVYKYNVIGVI